jgi:pyruvyltransferase
LPEHWEGTVLGTGSLYPDSKVPYNAEYLAVRGPLTAALTGSHDVALGDAGLLANELVPQQHRKYNVGVIPHWSDKDMERRFWGDGAVLIDVTDDPLLVVKKIASCKRIISSSLHGIIVADAYGIPRRTELTPQFAKEGGDHKFRDHNAAVGVPFRVGEWQSPVFSRVEDRQHELYDAFNDFGHYLRRQAWAATASPS